MRGTRTPWMITTAAVAAFGTTGCTGALEVTGLDLAGPSDSEEESQQTEVITDPPLDSELFEQLDHNAEQLEEVASEMTLTFQSGPTESRGTLSTEGAADFSSGHLSVTSEEYGTTSETEMYVDETSTYIQEEDYGWYEQTLPDSPGGYAEDTSYLNVVDALTDLEDVVEVTMEGQTILISYTGSDREVFEAFEEPFSLTLDGIAVEDTVMTLEAEVDADTLHMTDLDFELDATPEDSPMDLMMTFELAFSDFDEVGDVEVPQEVIDEARANGGAPDQSGGAFEQEDRHNL